MKKMLTLLLALTLSTATAHTAVTSLTPAANATVTAPKTVALTFSEPIELRFCTFRVMAIPAGKTAQDTATLALAEKADSAKLASLPFKAGDMAARLTLPLRPGLKPGGYVVAWKILSEDGHPVSGLSTFQVK